MLPKETKRVRSDVDVTQVVLAARDFARRLHFSEVESRAIGTAVSELATNILKYAEYGQVTIREVREGGRAGIEAVATDHGPGIEDIREALQDHFSSSGTLGLGLPGVRRLMDDFDIRSTAGEGTSVTIRKWLPAAKRARGLRSVLDRTTASDGFVERGTERWSDRFEDPSGQRPPLDVAFVNRPCRGELVSGDAVLAKEVDDGVLLLALIDGLGHGRDAHTAAKTAARFLRRQEDLDLGRLMTRLDDHLKGTVGAAVGLCRISLTSGRLQFSGVGNTVLRLEGDRPLRPTSLAGTVGSAPRTARRAPRAEVGQLDDSGVLLMYTDGISDRASFDDYPQLRYHSPAKIVETMLARYGKKHDDSTCLACRYGT
jgi:anti-sigma regulatory factor (Ser/Thr protein kinase)